MGAAAAAVVSQAIAGFGAHLAAQAFAPPAMELRDVVDIYFEGLLAPRPGVQAGRVRGAWGGGCVPGHGAYGPTPHTRRVCFVRGTHVAWWCVGGALPLLFADRVLLVI